MSREEFLRLVRDSLGHLYNPEYLRATPLATLLGVGGRADTPSALRRILTEAIERLEPPADEPMQSRAWRIYNALLYLYVQQMKQENAADMMGLSSRQVRREQRAGVRVLADRLWERFGLDGAPATGVGQPATPTIGQELAWLQHVPPGTSSDLGQVLRGVLDLAQSLATRHRTRLEIALPDGLPRVAVHPVALRQIVLGLLRLAMQQAEGSSVTVSAHPVDGCVEVGVSRPGSPPEDAIASLATVRQIVDLCKGSLRLANEAGTWKATIALPASVRIPVLVIDDNADTLQLLQRYAAQTRYQLITTTDPGQAFALAETHAPRIIVLDVMMPQVDGWEVLSQLRQSIATEHIPVIVCTVLADAELAISLGASAFVPKPVTREAFLDALDRVAEEMRSRSG